MSKKRQPFTEGQWQDGGGRVIAWALRDEERLAFKAKGRFVDRLWEQKNKWWSQSTEILEVTRWCVPEDTNEGVSEPGTKVTNQSFKNSSPQLSPLRHKRDPQKGSATYNMGLAYQTKTDIRNWKWLLKLMSRASVKSSGRNFYSRSPGAFLHFLELWMACAMGFLLLRASAFNVIKH